MNTIPTEQREDGHNILSNYSMYMNKWTKWQQYHKRQGEELGILWYMVPALVMKWDSTFLMMKSNYLNMYMVKSKATTIF